MLKKLFILIKIARKLAKSEALSIASKFQEPPTTIKIFFKILSFSFSSNQKNDFNISEKEKFANSLQSMGTTFIKLGQLRSIWRNM